MLNAQESEEWRGDEHHPGSLVPLQARTGSGIGVDLVTLLDPGAISRFQLLDFARLAPPFFPAIVQAGVPQAQRDKTRDRLRSSSTVG